jgi:hypothetical protein
VITAAAPLSRMMCRISGGLKRALIGTIVAPASETPNRAVRHSKPFGTRTPTRSPGRTPSAARLRAIRCALSASSA